MYLVTSALKELWPKEEFWLLNQGCNPDPFDLDIEKNFRIKGILPDPFANGEENKKHYDEIWNITVDLIDSMTLGLNQIHGVNFDSRYWGILTGFWVLNYVTVFYDRIIQLSNAKEKIKDLVLVGSEKECETISETTLDFVLASRSDDLYNIQIYTDIAKELGVPKEEFPFQENTRQTIVAPKTNSLLRILLQNIRKFTFRTIEILFGSRAKIITHDSYFPKWFDLALFLKSFGQIIPIESNFEFQFEQNPIDRAKREILQTNIQKKSGIKGIIYDRVWKYIPKIYIEGYSNLQDLAKERYKSYSPKGIYSANSWFFNEVFLAWTASSYNKNVKLIGGEHGGAPYLGRYSICSRMEILKADKYFTWGWSDSLNKKVIPTPGAKLIHKGKDQTPPKGDNIFFVCTAESRYAFAAIENFAKYLEWQNRFFKSIPVSLAEKFIVRSHYNDFGWRIRDRIKLVKPQVQFDDWSITYNKRLDQRNFKLYVFDYLSTTFLESMARNLPSILYLDSKNYPILEKFNSYFEALKEVNIFHDSPESAANWIEKIYNSSDWFYEEKCQKVVTDFCYFNARTSSDPLNDWKKILDKIVVE